MHAFSKKQIGKHISLHFAPVHSDKEAFPPIQIWGNRCSVNPDKLAICYSSAKMFEQIDNAKFDPEALPPVKLKDLQLQNQFRLVHAKG